MADPSLKPPPRKKLIEVALPLEAINRESAREKSIRHGHPSTLHLWWARRPLAACRAVLFSSLVDDPSSDPALRRPDGSHDEGVEGERRGHLFNLIEAIVKWENSGNDVVVNAARAEIARAVASRKLELGELKKNQPLSGGITPWDLIVKGQVQTRAEFDDGHASIAIERPQLPANAVNAFLAEYAPPVLDPFCGGGSIPLEAQRLGLRAFGSDLNPVPVLITKALIEIPPKFAGMSPVNPESRGVGVREARLDGKASKGKKASVQLKGASGAQRQLALGTQSWKGAAGLAEDVRYYGRWMRDEAQKRIGHLYPKITVTEAMARDRKDLKDYVGQDLTVIAWLWARTVPSPNPAAGGAYVPLVRSFWLSTKEGKRAWVEPLIAPDGKSYKFEVRAGTPAKDFDPKKGTVVRTGATCLLTNQPMSFEHVRAEAKAGRMGARLMVIVAEGTRGRVYLSPTPEHEKAAQVALPKNIPDTPIPEQALGFRVQNYGMDKHYKLFTSRQLVAMTMFSDLVMEARAKVLLDARAAGLGAGLALEGEASKVGITPSAVGDMGSPVPAEGSTGSAKGFATNSKGWTVVVEGSTTTVEGPTDLADGFTKTVDRSTGAVARSATTVGGRSGVENGVSEAVDGAERYADAVATYLAFGVSKTANRSNALCPWMTSVQCPGHLFSRHAISMNWDYSEANVISGPSGSFESMLENTAVGIDVTDYSAVAGGRSEQRDACNSQEWAGRPIVSIDPPYYDNIGYADLSDFFYIWLRRSLGDVYPSLFQTLLTPKAEELIATPFRHDGDMQAAMTFFETGLGRAFLRMREAGHTDYPLTIFYAFKQSEEDEGDEAFEEADDTATVSTGWETMLEGLVRAGFAITGTWPSRSERGNRVRAQGSNALASSIVLVCHPRSENAPMASRREFVAALKRELPAALRDLQSGNIAPVDLAQAAIGPGMAVYSRYSKVLETSGERLGVRAALALINQVLDEVLAEQEGEYDPDTRWCMKWFEQFGHGEGTFGEADVLARAMAVGVNGLVETGVAQAKGGRVRLFKRTELMGGKPESWDPATDDDILHWEVCQYMCWALETGGEQAAADLYGRINAAYAGATEVARDLAYRLYTICERKKWAPEAIAYNALIVSWSEIQKLALKGPAAPEGLLYS